MTKWLAKPKITTYLALYRSLLTPALGKQIIIYNTKYDSLTN